MLAKFVRWIVSFFKKDKKKKEPPNMYPFF